MNSTPKNTNGIMEKRERGRPISIENYRKVIESLQKKPRSWSELEKVTGIPKSSLDRILKFFESLGLILKDEKLNMWFWYSHKREIESKEEWELFKKHSKELVSGFAYLLRRLGITKISLKNYEFKESDEKDMLILERLSECAYRHLETGYPQLHQKIEECYSIGNEIRSIINSLTSDRSPFSQNINASLDVMIESDFPFKAKLDSFGIFIARILSFPWEALARLKYKAEVAKLSELKEKLFSLLKEIYGELNLLILQIENREEPLLGECPYCPKITLRIKEMDFTKEIKNEN